MRDWTNGAQRAAIVRVTADSGAVSEVNAPLPNEPVAASVSRLAALRQRSQGLSYWLQLRGTTRLEATEGMYTLCRGDWMVFDHESQQELQAMRDGLTVGLVLPRHFPLPEGGLVPGAGRAREPDVRIALNLWRRCCPRAASIVDTPAAMRPLLLHLQYLQDDLHGLADRCPGRTIARKRQVLARMQRVRMFMEGNAHRSVRLAELAELSRFSEWWVSKTFRAIYGETVQETSLRLRMQRARDLLENTSLSISELGEACGFHDPCSFARLFKHRHGQTASRWRARSQARRQIPTSQSPALSPVFGHARS